MTWRSSRLGSYEEAKANGFPHRALVWCRTCGGSYIEAGVSAGKTIPHAKDCPRNPATMPLPRPYTPEEQDRDAAALRKPWAPVQVPVHPVDCPCGCADRDDYILGGR